MRLPPELIAHIIAHIPAADTPTLATLLRVSRILYALAAPSLYRDLRVSEANLAGVLCGLIDGVDNLRSGSGSESELEDASQPDHEGQGRQQNTGDRSQDKEQESPLRAYPSPASNARKRALLAYTTTLRITSVPAADVHPYAICPMDRRTFPAVRSVLVYTAVPHHSKRRAPAL